MLRQNPSQEVWKYYKYFKLQDERAALSGSFLILPDILSGVCSRGMMTPRWFTHGTDQHSLKKSFIRHLLFVKFLHLIGKHLKGFLTPKIAESAHFYAEVGEELSRLRQLIPDLWEEGRFFGPVLKHDAVNPGQ